MIRNIQIYAIVMMSLASASCDPPNTSSGFLWAVNVAGPAYRSSDGIAFRGEEYVSGGTRRRLETVLGSQDPALYQDFRMGDIAIDRPLVNGVYDVVFFFAEPDEVETGDRLVDVLINGAKRIEALDVMRSRDGKTRSALTVGVPDVRVAGGRLRIELSASAGEAVLSALVVRAKATDTGRWQLVWSDEFDTDGRPDPGKWNIEEWAPRVVNDEDQAYTARPRNVRVANGHLILEAHREDYGKANYTSARMQSQGKGDFLYGRFEVRAKLPRGQGTWPAIWMLPSDPFAYATTCSDDSDWQGSATCDAWPNSGEIDIMEHVGYEMGHVHGTVHTKAYYWAVWEQRKGRILIPDVDDAFHVYALEWSPQRIDVFVDDSLYFTYVNEDTGWETWPFDRPFHLILNVAVGGMWGRAGGPIDDSIFPQQMLVDYVRVYEGGEGVGLSL